MPARLRERRPSKTEADMLGLLRKRYLQDAGNGPAWAFIPHVRNAAGFDATNTCDAIAMALWPSRGLELLGFEIKCSRSDWQRELIKPAKAEAFTGLVDRWWVVAATPDIVRDGELPPTWGLLVPHGQGLKAAVDAPRLRQGPPPAMTRSFLAALLRSAARTHTVQPEEVTAAVEAERASWRATMDRTDERHQAELQRVRAKLTAFEEAAGIRLGEVGAEPERRWYGNHDPAKVGAALREILTGGVRQDELLRRFETIARSAEELAAQARRAAGHSPP